MLYTTIPNLNFGYTASHENEQCTRCVSDGKHATSPPYYQLGPQLRIAQRLSARAHPDTPRAAVLVLFVRREWVLIRSAQA